jgi:predicted DNA-binding ribbon-helix-helix protein
MRKDNVIQIRISTADKEKLEEIATQKKLKVSELIDEYIQSLINNTKEP